MFDISFPIAFVAGLVSFFAPCVVPLLPAYIGYVTGVSLKDLQVSGFEKYRNKIIVSSIFYILGFSLVFVILGTAAAGVGYILRQFDDVIRVLGGILIIVLGLEFAGFLNMPFLAAEHKFKLPSWTGRLGYGRAFLVGIVFALAWTPCVGAVLGTVLSLAAVSKTALTGAGLLFAYSLGISLPFMFVSLTLAHAPRYMPLISKKIGFLAKMSGIFLIFLGILLLTDTYKYVNGWLFEIAFNLGYQVK